MLEKLLRFCIRTRRWLIFGALILAIAGFTAVRSLRVDLFPPLNFPILNVITEVPGYSSFEMERQVTVPLESAAGGVLGVTKVRSTSGTAISMVSVEFEWGTDMLLARQLLNEALTEVRAQLPSTAATTVENLSASLSMIEGFSLSGGENRIEMRDRAVYDLKPRLQRIPGVYKVVVMGGETEEYSVTPNLHALVKYDMTLENLKDALVSNNLLASPGVVNAFSQEWIVQTNGQFSDAKELGNSVVAVKSGTPIRMAEVAEVRRGVRYERGDTSENGKGAVHIEIVKQPAYDTGKVAGAVFDEVEHFRKTLKPPLKIVNFYDQNELVQASIGSVTDSVWIGGILVVFILLFFLRDLRSTVIATVSIPVSVTVAIVLMKLLKTDLNIMSLGGLAIGTGIIVDDTIVVMENIFRWLAMPEARTRSRLDTIYLATHEVIRPVIVSTLTNIGIFLPMILVEGFAGRLFQPVSVTVTLALLASLVVALFVIPSLAFAWLKPAKEGAHSEGDGPLQLAYSKLLSRIIRKPVIPLLACLALFPLVFLVIRGLDVEFLPSLDEGAILLQTIMPQGTSLQESVRLNRKIEQWVAQVPGVETVVRRTGHAPGAEDTDNVNHSDITVKLVPKGKRPIGIDAMIDALKGMTDPIMAVQVNYLMPLTDKINDALGGVPAEIGIDFYGLDLEKLRTEADSATKLFSTIPGLIDIRPPLDQGVPSYYVKVDRDAAGKFGISEATVANALEAFSSGLEATSVKEVQKEIPVTLYLGDPKQNVNLEALKHVPLRTAGGSMVPLERIAAFSWRDIPSEINHEHLTRKITLTANIKGRTATDVAHDMESALGKVPMDAGYNWAFTGKYKTERSALANLLFVLLLAIVTVASILWLEFQSVKEVSLILLTIPFAAVGAIFGLWTFHQTLNVSSMIGAVMLVGIVVRNGIILLDYVNLQLRAGVSLEDAVIIAAKQRVRPILMTASVTILGLLPLAAGYGSGAELQKPLAIAVICGLISSTALTLILLPSAAVLLRISKKDGKAS
jgi:CzcA family heavy metal efflux pump